MTPRLASRPGARPGCGSSKPRRQSSTRSTWFSTRAMTALPSWCRAISRQRTSPSRAPARGPAAACLARAGPVGLLPARERADVHGARPGHRPVGGPGPAAADRHVPLDVLHLEGRDMRARYGAGLVLIRPDQHVAWRADAPPADPGSWTGPGAPHRSPSSPRLAARHHNSCGAAHFADVSTARNRRAAVSRP